MKKIILIAFLISTLTGCVKNKCYIVLGAGNQELCAKCFHTIDERTVWIQANQSKTPEQQCQ